MQITTALADLPDLDFQGVMIQCANDHGVSITTVTILKIDVGYGIHVCDSSCRERCLLHCDDSDWIVEMEYGTNGYRALYGVLDGQIGCWQD